MSVNESNPLVTVNLVVLNGEKYIRHFLNSLEKQTYPHEKIQLNILDNGSSDNTKIIIGKFSFADFNLIESKQNLGMWPGQEKLLEHSNGKYIVASSVDIILDKDFIKNFIIAMEQDAKIGAIQPKIYKFELSESRITKKIIDTCGFKIFRSRRVVNIGHGEQENGQFDNTLSKPFNKAHGKQFDFNKQQEIFAVEGAVPIFRTEALKSLKISGEITDHDYFWYGDDLDLAWRMRIFGWKQVFMPNVMAWHDRQTTKTLKKSWSDYLARVPVRGQIPIKKRRLDWRNLRWTFVKNDYIINILKDLPWILPRELAVLGYAILFEPGVLREIPTFLKHFPKMLHKRKEIMKRAIVKPGEIRKWFY